MKIHGFIFLSILLLFCSGCPKVAGSAPTGEAFETPVSETTIGDYRHELSGLTFANNYGEFTRDKINRYDTTGNNLSFHYNSPTPSCKVSISTFLFPAPMIRGTFIADESVRKEQDKIFMAGFLAATQLYEQRMTIAKFVSAGEITLKPFPWGRRITYNIKNYLTSEVRFFQFEHQENLWHLKFQITYQQNCQEDANKQIDYFMSGFTATRDPI